MNEDQAATDGTTTSFSRIVCGLDGSPQSVEAARQAIALAAPSATIWAVASWDPSVAHHAGIHAGTVAADLRRAAEEALKAATAELPALEPHSIAGADVASLLSATSDLDADLIAVGSHGGSRTAGLLFGSVATAICRHAPCSVLVARETREGGADEPTVVTAVDGSEYSLDAARVAALAAERLGARVLIISAGEDREQREAAAEAAGSLAAMASVRYETETCDGAASKAIIEAAGDHEAQLVVVGSRGLTGLQALGSTGERVAHRAPCSVLVVRRPAHPARD